MLIHADSFSINVINFIHLKPIVLKRSCTACDWLILTALSEDTTSVLLVYIPTIKRIYLTSVSPYFLPCILSSITVFI